MTIGERLKQARKSRKYTQEQVSEILGFSPTKISKIECDKQPVTADEVKDLCDLYQCDYGYIFDGYKEYKEAYHVAAQTTGLSQYAIRVLELTKKLRKYNPNNLLEYLITAPVNESVLEKDLGGGYCLNYLQYIIMKITQIEHPTQILPEGFVIPDEDLPYTNEFLAQVYRFQLSRAINLMIDEYLQKKEAQNG